VPYVEGYAGYVKKENKEGGIAMTRNVTVSSKTGKMYDIHSYQVVSWEDRSIPDFCTHCGEAMYENEDLRDDLRLYTVMVFECRNRHQRTVFVEKKQ